MTKSTLQEMLECHHLAFLYIFLIRTVFYLEISTKKNWNFLMVNLLYLTNLLEMFLRAKTYRFTGEKLSFFLNEINLKIARLSGLCDHLVCCRNFRD